MRYRYRNKDEMKDSGVEWIGKIPKEWDILKFKRITNSVKNGIWGDDERHNSDDIPCIRILNFERNKLQVDINDLTFRNIPKEKQGGYLLKQGDLLIEKSGGGEKNPVGFVAIYNHELPAVYANFIAKISLNDKAHSNFIRYLCFDVYSRRMHMDSVNQTTGIQNLDTERYFSRIISLPSIKEQEKIAKFLDEKTSEFDSLISKKEKLIEKLEEAKKSLISEVVTGKVKVLKTDNGYELVKRNKEEMKDSGVEWLGEIPKDWEVKKLKYTSEIYRGKFNHRPRNDPDYYDGQYPFIQTGDVAHASMYISKYSQTLNEKGYSVSKEFPRGTLVMTIAANIGDIAILDFNACFPDSIVGFVPYNFMNLKYMYYTYSIMKEEFMSTAIINTQMNLNIERIENLYIVFPNINIQDKIVDYIKLESGRMEFIINKTKLQIEKLKEAKQSLISEAVTGKIEILD